MGDDQFRWLFGTDTEKEEFDIVNRLFLYCKGFEVQHDGQHRTISFKELMKTETWLYAWQGAWPLLHQLNLRLKAFMFAAREIKFKGWIYERSSRNQAHPRKQMIYETSGPVTLVSATHLAEWEILLDEISRDAVRMMPSLGSPDKEFSSLIAKISTNDFKDFYIAYEQICRKLGIHVRNSRTLSHATGVPEDRLDAFLKTANDVHRHYPVRPPPTQLVEIAEAKLLILKLFIAWIRRR